MGWSSHRLELPSLQENEDTLNRAMAIRTCAGKAGPGPRSHRGPQEEQDALALVLLLFLVLFAQQRESPHCLGSSMPLGTACSCVSQL